MSNTKLPPHPQTIATAEFGDIQALDTSLPGYSAQFLRQLNAHPNIRQAEVKGTLKKIEHRATAGSNFPENEKFSEAQKNYVESKALQGFFLPQIFKDLLEWERQSGYYFGNMREEMLVPMRPEEVEREFRASGLDIVKKSIKAENLIQNTEHAIANAWGKNMEALTNNPAYKNDFKVKAYIRLKQLLFKRHQVQFPELAKRITWHQVEVGVQMRGVLDQARQIVWTLFRTASEICHYHYSLPEAGMQVKVGQASTTGRGLSFALASCQPGVAKTVITHLNHGQSTFGNNQGYDPSNFRLLEINDKTYLELSPAIFPALIREVSKRIETTEPSIMTRCPAVFVTDDSNRSIVSSYYDINVELFKGHCLG